MVPCLAAEINAAGGAQRIGSSYPAKSSRYVVGPIRSLAISVAIPLGQQSAILNAPDFLIRDNPLLRTTAPTGAFLRIHASEAAPFSNCKFSFFEKDRDFRRRVPFLDRSLLRDDCQRLLNTCQAFENLLNVIHCIPI